MSSEKLIETLAELEACYPRARPASRAKQHASLTSAMRDWLARSPFFVLSSIAETGIDCSPRGDAPGTAFRLLDASRLVIPDRRGNNRIDTLRNIIADSRVGMVFMVPGIEETLRVRGRASISIDAALLASFALDGEQPASVIVVDIEAAWVQNFRSIRRAELWSDTARVEAADMPDARALAGENGQ